MIIGIDPGVQNIGVAVIDELLEVHSVHYWQVGKSESSGYVNIVSQFTQLVNNARNVGGSHPLICIEKPFFTPATLPRNVRTLEVIGLFKYALYANCGMLEDCIRMYSPATIKKQITGDGRADKDAVILAAKHVFQQTRSFNSHEADALAIAYTGWKLDLKN